MEFPSLHVCIFMIRLLGSVYTKVEIQRHKYQVAEAVGAVSELYISNFLSHCIILLTQLSRTGRAWYKSK